MEITRQYYEREGCYYYYLKQDNKILEITFGGNLDLYWSLRIIKDYKLTIEKNRNAMYDEVKGTFIITKENYFIYSLFEELYDDIKQSRIFIPTELKPDIDYFDSDEIDLDLLNYMSEEEANKKMKDIKKLQHINYSLMVKLLNGTVMKKNIVQLI